MINGQFTDPITKGPINIEAKKTCPTSLAISDNVFNFSGVNITLVTYIIGTHFQSVKPEGFVLIFGF